MLNLVLFWLILAYFGIFLVKYGEFWLKWLIFCPKMSKYLNFLPPPPASIFTILFTPDFDLFNFYQEEVINGLGGGRQAEIREIEGQDLEVDIGTKFRATTKFHEIP